VLRAPACTVLRTIKKVTLNQWVSRFRMLKAPENQSIRLKMFYTFRVNTVESVLIRGLVQAKLTANLAGTRPSSPRALKPSAADP